jgi:hypothetical protein
MGACRHRSRRADRRPPGSTQAGPDDREQVPKRASRPWLPRAASCGLAPNGRALELARSAATVTASCRSGWTVALRCDVFGRNPGRQREPRRHDLRPASPPGARRSRRSSPARRPRSSLGCPRPADARRQARGPTRRARPRRGRPLPGRRRSLGGGARDRATEVSAAHGVVPVVARRAPELGVGGASPGPRRLLRIRPRGRRRVGRARRSGPSGRGVRGTVPGLGADSPYVVAAKSRFSRTVRSGYVPDVEDR